MKRLEFLDGGTSAFIGFDDRFVGTRISALGHKRLFGGRLFGRIQHADVEMGEVPHVARNNGQIMHESRCRNHGVFIDGAGLAVHELGPSAKAHGVHREYVVRIRHLIRPRLEFLRLDGILSARQLDAGLYLSDRYCGKMQIGVLDVVKPGDDLRIRARLAQFRDDVGVE